MGKEMGMKQPGSMVTRRTNCFKIHILETERIGK
jgi:hypothetical protein